MDKAKVPETLYGYVIYFEGFVTRCFSESSCAEAVWGEIAHAREDSNPIVRFWIPADAGRFSEMLVDAYKVVAVRTNEEEIAVTQPHLEAQRKADQNRRVFHRIGRVNLGQIAPPHARKNG